MVVEVLRMVHDRHLKCVMLVHIHLKAFPVHLWLQPQETMRMCLECTQVCVVC